MLPQLEYITTAFDSPRTPWLHNMERGGETDEEGAGGRGGGGERGGERRQEERGKREQGRGKTEMGKETGQGGIDEGLRE